MRGYEEEAGRERQGCVMTGRDSFLNFKSVQDILKPPFFFRGFSMSSTFSCLSSGFLPDLFLFSKPFLSSDTPLLPGRYSLFSKILPFLPLPSPTPHSSLPPSPPLSTFLLLPPPSPALFLPCFCFTACQDHPIFSVLTFHL